MKDYHKIEETMCDNLDELLDRKGISIQQLAELTKTKQPTVYKFINGSYKCVILLKKIADLFNVPTDYILSDVRISDRSKKFAFSSNLFRLIERDKLTLKQLSKDTDIPEHTLVLLLTGDLIPDSDILEKISCKFDVSLRYLLSDNTNEDVNNFNFVLRSMKENMFRYTDTQKKALLVLLKSNMKK